MKICLVTTWEQECGIAEYSKHLVQLFVQMKHDVQVITEVIQRGKINAAIPMHAVWYRTNFHKPIFDLIKKLAPDVVHFQHEFGLFSNTLEFNKLIDDIHALGIKVVVTLHTIPKWKQIWFSNNATYIAHTHNGWASIKPYYTNVVHIPHWIEFQDEIAIGPKQDLLNKYKITCNDYFFVPGFMNENKAQLETIQAFLKTGITDHGLILAGLVRDSSYLIRLISEADTSGHKNIRILPKFLENSERDELYRHCKGVILNTKRDTDYSASGQLHTAIGWYKPIVAKSVEIFKEPLGGAYLFNTQDDLVKAIENMVYPLEIASIATNQDIELVANDHIELYKVQNYTKDYNDYRS